MAFAPVILNNRNALASLIAIGLVISTAPMASAQNAAAAAPAQDQLTTVINGVQKASYSIISAKGNVNVHEWRTERGSVYESEINYKVAIEGMGRKYRCESSRVGIKNPEGPDAWNIHNTKLASAKQSLTLYSFDGQKLTKYYVQQNLAQMERGEHGTLSFDFPYVMNKTGLWINTPSSSMSSSGELMTFKAAILRNEPINGSDCIVVETIQKITPPDKKTWEIANILWVDPKRGYSVAKRQVYGVSSGSRRLIDQMTTDLKDYGEGVWGPSKCVIENFEISKNGKNERTFRSIVTYDKDFKVNVKLKRDDLTLKLPKGTRVEDKITNKVYRAK